MKHDFYTKRGVIDTFRYQFGDYHNGPECRRCGECWCMHCESDRLDEECFSGQLEFDLVY